MREGVFRPAGRAVALMVAVLAAMAWRRPDQLLHPYLWVEEGTVFIPQLLQWGWRFLFQPVAGYILLPSKIIFLAAAKISFSHLPQIAYCLTVLFEWSVCLAVAALPTYLRKTTLCAIALLLLPIDSEVYAVSGYAFWFGTILLFLGLLWREDALDRVRLRAVVVFIGGFSSPMVVPLCIFFAWRSLRANDRREDTIAVIALVAAAVQAVSLHVASLPNPADGVHVTQLHVAIAKFLGWFVYYPGEDGIVVGFVIGLAMLAIMLAVLRRAANFGLCLLLAIFATSIVSSVLRAPLQSISAFHDGPRYFFYPYLLLSWLLIYCLAVGRRWEKVVFSLLLLASLRQTYLFGQRRHETLNWRGQVAACEASTMHTFPIHYAGKLDHLWHVTLSGSQCRRLVKHSLTGS